MTDPFDVPPRGPSSSDRSTIPGVQKSLWSILQGKPWSMQAQPAATLSWHLIKGVRNHMPKARESLAYLGSCSPERLQTLRDAALRSSKNKGARENPARQELVNDILRMLDGFLYRASAAPAAPQKPPQARAPFVYPIYPNGPPEAAESSPDATEEQPLPLPSPFPLGPSRSLAPAAPPQSVARVRACGVVSEELGAFVAAKFPGLTVADLGPRERRAQELMMGGFEKSDAIRIALEEMPVQPWEENE